jgi:hypothetical protein
MKTEDLILELSKTVTPVKRLESPLKRTMKWLSFTTLSLLSGVAIMGVREDIGLVIFNKYFWVQSFLLSVLAIASAVSAFLINIPGEKRKSLFIIPAITFIGWGLILLIFVTNVDRTSDGIGFACIRDISLLGLLPGVGLFIMLRKGAPLKIGFSGVLALLAISSIGALGTQFICSNDDPLHILLWHFLPVLILSLVGVIIGKALLQWETK